MSRARKLKPIDLKVAARKQVGLRLRDLREEAGFSLQDVADRLGYSDNNSIRVIEKGIVDIQVWAIPTLCKMLKCSADQLFGVHQDEARLVQEVQEEDREFMLELGIRIMACRRRKGWRQLDLALKTGISQPVISRLENGLGNLPSDAMVKKLATALGCSLKFLMTGEASK